MLQAFRTLEVFAVTLQEVKLSPAWVIPHGKVGKHVGVLPRVHLDQALHSAELHVVFDGSRTADETAGKPNPRMLHELMREFGTEPERTLMIGDRRYDIEGAAANKVSGVGVLWGHETELNRLGVWKLGGGTVKSVAWDLKGPVAPVVYRHR